MRSLAGSHHFNSSLPINTAYQYKEGKGSSKKMEIWLNTSLKIKETKDELSTTCNLK